MAKLKPWEVSDELWAVIEPLLPQSSGGSGIQG
ncbi:transposase [Nonomuraea sp. NPDC004702]